MTFRSTLTSMNDDKIDSYSVCIDVARISLLAGQEKKLTTSNEPLLVTGDIRSIFHADTVSLVKAKNEILSSKAADDIYPIAVRYIDNKNNYYIERPPFQVTVDLSTNRSRRNNRKTTLPYKIWIPWTITIFNPNSFNDVRIFFSDKSLSSFDDLYINCLLPNTYNDSRICFGNSLSGIPLEGTDSKDIRYLYSLIFNEYMNGGWNLDLAPNIHNYNYFLIKNKDNISQFPMIAKFMNPDKDLIKKLYPKMTALQIERIDSDMMLSSYVNIFRYFFTQLSTFSLEETLAFYSELSQYTGDKYSGHNNEYRMPKSFQKITSEKVSAYSDELSCYKDFDSNIKLVLNNNSDINYNKYILKQFDLIINNYDFTNYNLRLNLNYRFLTEMPQSLNLSGLITILQEVINTDAESENAKKIYILDRLTNEVSYRYLQDGCTLDQFYLDYIDEYHEATAENTVLKNDNSYIDAVTLAGPSF